MVSVRSTPGHHTWNRRGAHVRIGVNREVDYVNREVDYAAWSEMSVLMMMMMPMIRTMATRGTPKIHDHEQWRCCYLCADL